MTYYAKSSQPDGAQETVRQHLQCVEILAQTYGRTFGAEIPAGLCGLFHDFGKCPLPAKIDRKKVKKTE